MTLKVSSFGPIFNLMEVNVRPSICCCLIIPSYLWKKEKKKSGGIWQWCATVIFFHLPLRSHGHFTIICEISCSSRRSVCTKCTSRSVYFMPRGEEMAAAAEENKWEGGKVMNRTVGKLAGDGLWTFVTPIEVVSVARLDFGLLLLFCKKKGGVIVLPHASRASRVSGEVQCSWWDEKVCSFLALYPAGFQQWFLPFACLMHEHRGKAISSQSLSCRVPWGWHATLLDLWGQK